jgi:hypothetical protein
MHLGFRRNMSGTAPALPSFDDADMSDVEAAWLAGYITQCDEALAEAMERGDWPNFLRLPTPHRPTHRHALHHWLDEVRREHGPLLRVEFDPHYSSTTRTRRKGQPMSAPGRKPKLTPHQQREAKQRVAGGKETLREIARSYDVHSSTISRLPK